MKEINHHSFYYRRLHQFEMDGNIAKIKNFIICAFPYHILSPILLIRLKILSLLC